MTQAAMSPKVLKALAHPARQLIVAELRASGPARAADLAQRIDLPANSISFHLRTLGDAGVIAVNPKLAKDRKERWWRLVFDAVEYNDADVIQTHEGRAALAAYERNGRVSLRRLIDHVLSARESGDCWSLLIDGSMRMSETDVAEMRDEFAGVFKKYQGRTHSSETNTQLVFGVTLFAPLDEVLQEPEPD